MKRLKRVRPNDGDVPLSNLNKAPNNSARKTDQQKRGIRKINIKDELTSFLRVYRYVQPIDYGLIGGGIVFALAQGLLNSISSVIFKSLTDSFSIAQRNVINDSAFATTITLRPGSLLTEIQFNEFYSGALDAVNAYVGCGIGLLFVAFAANACWRILCERQIKNIRAHYFNSLIRQNSAWFNAHEPDDTITEMSNGIDIIKECTGERIGILIAYTVNFICCVIIAFCYSWKMTLMMLGFIPLLAGLISIVAQFVAETARVEMWENSGVNAIAKEVFNGIRIVIAYNGQEQESNRYAAKLEEAAGLGIRKSLLVAVGTALIYCLIFIAMAVTFWFGTLVSANGEITAGDVFATFWAIMGGIVAIGHAAKQIAPILAARKAIASVFEVIDHKPDANSVSMQFGTMDVVEGNIEFRNVHYSSPFEMATRLIDVNFEVPARKSIALIGPTDSGIFALAGLLLRFHNLESGEISLDGVSLDRLNVSWLRHTIGIIQSEPVIFDGSIEQNIRLGDPNMSDDQMRILCRNANAHNFILDLPEGYNTQVGEGGMKLSIDQKVRIAIARSMARNPKVLIIDQTAAVAYGQNEGVVNEALKRARQGRTSITITQRPSIAKDANYIFVFENGRIVEAGTDEELVRLNGLYAELVRAEESDELFSGKESSEEDGEPEDAKQFLSVPRSESVSNTDKWRWRLVRSLMSMPSSEKELEELKDEADQQRFQPAGIDEIVYFARKEWKLLIVALTAAVLRGLIFPIFSLIYGSVFKSISQPSREAMLSGARLDAVYFTLLGIFAAAFTFTGCFLFGWTSESLTARLRLQFFVHVLKQDGGYFDSPEHTPEKLIAYLSNDVPKIRVGVDRKLADVMQNMSAILVGVIIAFVYGPAITPLGILLAAILIGAQIGIALFLKKQSSRDSAMAHRPSRLVIEAIEHHETVQCLVQEQRFHDLFEDHMNEIQRHGIVRVLIEACATSLQACFAFINFACLYRLGVTLVGSNRYHPFSVFQVVESLNCASISLLTFKIYAPEYVRARFSAGLIFNMLRQRPKIDSYTEAGHRYDLFGSIAMKHLYFAYPTNRAKLVLRSVNLNIPEHTTVALIGPSACGKSAAIGLLERFYDPVDGVLSFDGMDSREINVRYLRSQMALVESKPVLFSYTVKENITYGLPILSHQQIEEAALLAGAHDFIQLLPKGYETLVGEDGVELTIAEQQKIAIARAIIRHPRILLLDEVTSELSGEDEREVQEALNRVRRGRTCVMATHRFSNARTADLIIVMKEGRIIEHGSHEQLLQQQGLYARLARNQYAAI